MCCRKAAFIARNPGYPVVVATRTTVVWETPQAAATDRTVPNATMSGSPRSRRMTGSSCPENTRRRSRIRCLTSSRSYAMSWREDCNSHTPEAATGNLLHRKNTVQPLHQGLVKPTAPPLTNVERHGPASWLSAAAAATPKSELAVTARSLSATPSPASGRRHRQDAAPSRRQYLSDQAPFPVSDGQGTHPAQSCRRQHSARGRS